MIALLSDNVVHDTNQGGRSEGNKAFRIFMTEMDRCYDENVTDLVIMTNEDGSRAAAEFIVHGIYKETADGLPPATGQRYSLPVGCFFEIRDDKISRVTNYYNLSDWLRMVS